MSRVAWYNNLEERLYKTSLPQLQTAITRATTRTWPMFGKKQTKLPIVRASGDEMNECTLLPLSRSLFCSMIRPRPLGVPYLKYIYIYILFPIFSIFIFPIFKLVTSSRSTVLNILLDRHGCFVVEQFFRGSRRNSVLYSGFLRKNS